MIDLGPAAEEVRRLAAGVRDEQMDGPTPCDGRSVEALLDHILGLSQAFRDAALKAPAGLNTQPPQDAPPEPLSQDWTSQLDTALDAVVAAWRDPAAWEGETMAGGVTLPAAQMGIVALDELVLHGWDLARATDQEFHCDPGHIGAVLGFTTAVAEAGLEARQGLFGPVVEVAQDAPPLDRALGLAGRDPGWKR